MTEKELREYLLRLYPAENETCEWKEFKNAISDGREPVGNGYDGFMANRVIEAIYKSNKEQRTITL